MSRYPDHQVQALARAITGDVITPLKGSQHWLYAEYALEFLGIEPELPPTITVTVELPREEAEHVHRNWSDDPEMWSWPGAKVQARFAAAVNGALQ